MIGPTENQCKALEIIRDNPKIRGIQFARLMWADSNMHKQSDRIVNRNGLYYMFNLVKRSWVTCHNYKFELTKEGLKELNNNHLNINKNENEI